MKNQILVSKSRRVAQWLGLLAMVGVFLSIFGGQRGPTWRIAKKLNGKGLITTDRASSLERPASILNAPVLNAIFFGDDTNGCAAGDGGTLVCTNNGGRTWDTKPLDSSFNLNGGFFRNKLKGWAVGNAKGTLRILVTEDAGRNWRVQYKLADFELSGLHAVWFADEYHGWTVGEIQENGLTQGIILATADGGEHWQVQYRTEKRSSGLSAVSFDSALHGWAVGQNVILQTEDGGRHWREARYVDGENYFNLHVVDFAEIWVVGSNGTLLRTTDNGVTWDDHRLPLKYQNVWLSSVGFVTRTQGWVAGDNGAIFSTNNGGRIWKLESIGMSEFLRGLALTSRALFAVGNGGIILRRDL